MMAAHKFVPVTDIGWEKIDAVRIYKEFLHRQERSSSTAFKSSDGGRLTSCATMLHGATRGRPNAILGNPKCLSASARKTIRSSAASLRNRVPRTSKACANFSTRARAGSASVAFSIRTATRVRFYDGTREST